MIDAQAQAAEKTQDADKTQSCSQQEAGNTADRVACTGVWVWILTATPARREAQQRRAPTHTRHSIISSTRTQCARSQRGPWHAHRMLLVQQMSGTAYWSSLDTTAAIGYRTRHIAQRALPTPSHPHTEFLGHMHCSIALLRACRACTR